ncbi:MAG: chalcone isomerase family protein [Shewanella sp.]
MKLSLIVLSSLFVSLASVGSAYADAKAAVAITIPIAIDMAEAIDSDDGAGAIAPVSLEVGRTQMSLMWFDVYVATLLTPSGQYQGITPPLTLEIRYQREISATDLLDATREQWQHLGLMTDGGQRWLTELARFWPNVTAGDSLALQWDSDGMSQFYFNGDKIGPSFDKQFSNSFLAIWLSPQTSYPQLRLELIGEKSCDC